MHNSTGFEGSTVGEKSVDNLHDVMAPLAACAR